MGTTQKRSGMDIARLYDKAVVPTKKKKRPMEFSKKILLFAGFINVIVIGFAIYMMWKTCDLTPLAYLIPAVAAETATGTGFYYAKAKVENRIKLMRLYGVDLTANSFNDYGGNNYG